MKDEIKNEIATAEPTVPALSAEDAAIPEEILAAVPSAALPQKAPERSGNFRGGERRGQKGRGGRPSRRGSYERVKPEFDQKMIDIRRVTRVVAGGRRFSFSVALIVGDRKGAVGVGTGKASDTSLAIDKAFRDARKNLLHLQLTKNMSIPHEVKAKYSSGEIMIMPNRGKGLVVGSSARIALELAGVRDVTAKVLSGSKNKLNIARATLKALGMLLPPRGNAKKAGEKKEE